MNFIIENITIDENSCWNWKKSCSSSGYGQFTKNKIYYNTHRYVYELINGEIKDKNLVVRHKCNNTKCCNPEHLIIGTQKDNYQDSIEKHKKNYDKMRLNWIVGDVTYNSIREACKSTGITQSSLVKYTDKETRIFDIKTYRYSCEIAKCIPKI